MPESFADAGPDYLEQLLDTAIRAPAAAGDPASGRIAAGLLVALAAKGEDGRVEPYLSWGPGRGTTYEVRCFDQAERPAGSDRYATGGEAIRATGTCAARPGHTARVVAIADDGEERWMRAVRETAAIYRVPEPAERPDSPVATSEVVGALRQLLAEMTVHVDASAIEQVVRDAMAGPGHDPAAANGRPASADGATVEALVRAVVARLGGMIPTADDIADKVTRQIAAGRRDLRPGGLTRPRPTLPPPRPAPAPTATPAPAPTEP